MAPITAGPSEVAATSELASMSMLPPLAMHRKCKCNAGIDEPGRTGPVDGSSALVVLPEMEPTLLCASLNFWLERFSPTLTRTRSVQCRRRPRSDRQSGRRAELSAEAEAADGDRRNGRDSEVKVELAALYCSTMLLGYAAAGRRSVWRGVSCWRASSAYRSTRCPTPASPGPTSTSPCHTHALLDLISSPPHPHSRLS